MWKLCAAFMASARKSPKPARAEQSGPRVTIPRRAERDDPTGIVRSLAGILAEHSLTELVYDTPDITITLKRGLPGAAPVALPMALPAALSAAPAGHAAAGSGPAAAVVVEEKGHVVTSPFVGTFYRKPNPDAPNYVAINDRVDKGQVLCIVEAMKLMNEIEADISGTVIGIMAEDGAPVEYGQPLFKIAPG
jgi:acetyl-CoA carboxylase biotin carboxyl carrier protein